MKRWLNVLWLFIGLICLLGGVTWSVIAQTPAYPFNPPTFAGSNAPGNCANGSLFFNITSYLWQSCGPNNTWANLNGFPNSYLPPQAPVFGSSDTLSCSATTGITSAPVAFATMITLPAFTQTIGGYFKVEFTFTNTTSGSPPTFLFDINYGTTTIYSSAATAPSINYAGYTNISEFNIMASAVGTAGSLTSGFVGNISALATGIASGNHTTVPVTPINTTAPTVLSLLMQCGANTAGNTVTLQSITAQRIY